VRINLDSTGKKANSVTYVECAGREFEQPAEMVFITAFPVNNVRTLLLSGIGKPYDPRTGEGWSAATTATKPPGPDRLHGREHQRQSIHVVWRARNHDRRFRRRQLRPVQSGPVRRFDHDQRPSDRIPPHTARYAQKDTARASI
jgi:hypothetical protein